MKHIWTASNNANVQVVVDNDKFLAQIIAERTGETLLVAEWTADRHIGQIAPGIVKQIALVLDAEWRDIKPKPVTRMKPTLLRLAKTAHRVYQNLTWNGKAVKG